MCRPQATTTRSPTPYWASARGLSITGSFWILNPKKCGRAPEVDLRGPDHPSLSILTLTPMRLPVIVATRSDHGKTMQRGTNEDAYELLRQYFSKGTSMAG